MAGKLFAVLLIAASLLASGCTSLDKPKSTIEAFFDDLGRSIRQTTRRITGDEPPPRQSKSKAKAGLVLKIEKSSLAPATVQPGDQVKLTLRYRIAGAATQGVKVREKSSLARDGKELTVLKDESVDRENGTWENTLTFAVPHSAQSGRYTVTCRISAQGQSRSSQRAFTVQ
jgi:hypothetical protein